MLNNYFSQLRTAIPLLMAEYNIPGLLLSITDKENTLFSDCFGFTDSQKTNPVTQTTQFSLQSISKTYTAFAFMLAVQDRKVFLDDPLVKYMPEFHVRHRSGNDFSTLITFRQLLSHRSGLAHEAPIGNNFTYSSFEDHIKSINETYLRFKPDEKYSYSNLGIDLVAFVLGRIYGMSYENYVKEKLFTPLDMRNSKYDQHVIPMLGAGGMYSCSNDMMHFIRCFLNKGIYNNINILDYELLSMMYDKTKKDEWEYKIGIDVGLLHGKLVVNHNGGGYGFLATQDIFPDDGLGMAALSNSVDHPNVHQRICRSISHDFFELRSCGMEDCELLPEKLEIFIGLYEVVYNGGTWKISVVPRNGRLYCNEQELIQLSDGLFYTANDDYIEISNDVLKYNNILLRKYT